LFVEVNHGPFLVDNNIFLSQTALLDWSEGGAYAHNLFAGKIISRPEVRRETPYHPAHSTKVAGLVNIKGGDNRFYNNIFVGTEPTPAATPQKGDWRGRETGYGLWVYDKREFPLETDGNVYLNGARPYAKETNPVVQDGFNPKVSVAGLFVQLTLDQTVPNTKTTPVTTKMLGKAKVPGLPYENRDGTPLTIDTDYFGKKRNPTNPTAGPFENPDTGILRLRVR
jgi:hypothetical protein